MTRGESQSKLSLSETIEATTLTHKLEEEIRTMGVSVSATRIAKDL